MKTPSEFNLTRIPADGCVKIWNEHREMVENEKTRRGIAEITAMCMLRNTGPETVDAMNVVTSAIAALDNALSIILILTSHDGPYTIAGALYADIVLNPDIKDEAADALYKTIVEAALEPLVRPPGCIISWNPTDTVTAAIMKPHTANPRGPHTPSVH
ncbi:MAG: hypothetical protein OXG35_28660 [Acidobacteria bacterium]|nr:hypothetical protein [Acidobacteriota bacterium]